MLQKLTTVSDQQNIFKTYPGGKNVNGTYHKIINLIPPHDVYIEPFLGGGAILRHKKPASITVGNDLDTGIYEAWKNFQMDGFEMRNVDALQLIASVVPDKFKGVFLYLDPPYPMETRSCSKDIYNCESTPNLHENLLDLIVKVNCNCMISTYPNDLYSEKLKDWQCYEYESMTRGGVATELLYMNYPQPTELHDYQYLGDDCWDRQRIKRKIQRKIDTLSKLPILEQKAIIEGMNLSMATTSKNDCTEA